MAARTHAYNTRASFFSFSTFILFFYLYHSQNNSYACSLFFLASFEEDLISSPFSPFSDLSFYSLNRHKFSRRVYGPSVHLLDPLCQRSVNSLSEEMIVSYILPYLTDCFSIFKNEKSMAVHTNELENTSIVHKQEWHSDWSVCIPTICCVRTTKRKIHGASLRSSVFSRFTNSPISVASMPCPNVTKDKDTHVHAINNSPTLFHKLVDVHSTAYLFTASDSNSRSSWQNRIK